MSTNPQAGNGDLKTAVSNALKLLSAGENALAREQADEILRLYPDEINSLYIVAAVMRSEGDISGAITCLEGLIQRAPDYALAQQELGFSYAAQGRLYPAIAALQKAVEIQPSIPAAWKR